MFKIYYNHLGQITIVGASDEPGDFISCNEETMIEVQKGMTTMAHEVINGELRSKLKETQKQGKNFKFTKELSGWIVEKDNLFVCIKPAKVTPDWFDKNKHSCVNYD